MHYAEKLKNDPPIASTLPATRRQTASEAVQRRRRRRRFRRLRIAMSAATAFSIATMLVTARVFTVSVLFSATAALADWRHASSSFGQRTAYGRTCYRTVQNPFVYFGTKTTYGAVAGNDLQTPPGGCTYHDLLFRRGHSTGHSLATMPQIVLFAVKIRCNIP